MGDTRFGFTTHFDQLGSLPFWNPPVMMPLIAETGVQWIRDDWNWSLGERSPGVYSLFAPKQVWVDMAHDFGLSFCAILDPNLNNIYADPYDPTAAANYCAWLVQQEGPKIAAIEVTNEPFNYYAGVEGTNWQSKLVTLTQAVYTAVHAVSDTLVIGYGAQGTEILNMISMGGAVDGVVYHPYDSGNNIPETTYEPIYTNYANWVATLRAATSMPIYETERNGSLTGGNTAEYWMACWNARRLLQSSGLGVEHSFIYDFADSSNQSIMDPYYNKRQTWFVLQRVMNALEGLTTTGTGVTLTPGASNFDIADFYSYVFSGPSSTVAAVWLGNHNPGSPPTPGSGTITFTVNNTFSKPIIVDTVKGITLPLSVYNFSLVGNQMSVFAFPISDAPRMIIIR